MMLLIAPQGRERHPRFIDLAERTEVLAWHMVSGTAILDVAGLVNVQHTIGISCRQQIVAQQLQGAHRDEARIPTGFKQKELQLLYVCCLRLDQWLCIG